MAERRERVKLEPEGSIRVGSVRMFLVVNIESARTTRSNKSWLQSCQAIIFVTSYSSIWR